MKKERQQAKEKGFLFSLSTSFEIVYCLTLLSARVVHLTITK
jgi:hypothetical protein